MRAPAIPCPGDHVVRQVHRFNGWAVFDDAARRSRLRCHVEVHGQADLDGVGGAAGGCRHGSARLAVPCSSARAGHSKIAESPGSTVRPSASGIVVEGGHPTASMLTVTWTGAVGAVRHECAELDLVADTQEARQRRAHEERLRGPELALALADLRRRSPGTREGAPGGGVVREGQIEGRRAVSSRGELPDPERGVPEVRAHARAGIRRRGCECGEPGLAAGAADTAIASTVPPPSRLVPRSAAHPALLGRFGLAIRLVPTIDEHGEGRGGVHAQPAGVPERLDPVRALVGREREHGLVDNGNGDVGCDASPLGVGHGDLVRHGLAGHGFVTIRLDAHVQATRRRRDGEFDVAEAVARVRVVLGGRAVEHDAYEDVGDVRVLDRDAQHLAVGLQLAHLGAEHAPAFDGHERGGARKRSRDEDLGHVADLVLLAVGDKFDDVVEAHRPRHVVPAGGPHEARRARDAALVVGRLGDEPVPTRLRRREGERAFTLAIRRDAAYLDLGVDGLAAVVVPAGVRPLLRPHPFPLVHAHGDRAARGDGALVVDGHEVDRERLLGLAEVGLGLDAGVPGRGVHDGPGAAGDGSTARVGHGGADRDLARAVAIPERGRHLEARDA